MLERLPLVVSFAFLTSLTASMPVLATALARLSTALFDGAQTKTVPDDGGVSYRFPGTGMYQSDGAVKGMFNGGQLRFIQFG